MECVYHFEDNPAFGPAATALVDRIAQERQPAVSSRFVLSEILVVPRRDYDEFRYREDPALLSLAVTLAPYPRGAGELYSTLRAIQGVKPLDALHLSIAATAKVDYFLTADTKLQKLTVPGIGGTCPARAVAF